MIIITVSILQLALLLYHPQYHRAQAASFRGAGVVDPVAIEGRRQLRDLQSPETSCTGKKSKDCNEPACAWSKGECAAADGGPPPPTPPPAPPGPSPSSCGGLSKGACGDAAGCLWHKGDCSTATGAPTSPPTTANPTASPTTSKPTASPNKAPTDAPTPRPSESPSTSPTTAAPTAPPSPGPSISPTPEPTPNPTFALTPLPIAEPTKNPTPAPTLSPNSGPLTCPQQHCAGDAVNTAAIVDSSTVCPNLIATTLATFTHNGDVLIELTGPADMADAADLVITSPHGGYLEPSYIPDRGTSGPYCPSSGCKTVRDSYTLEISESLQSKVISNYCKVPFAVVNHLYRGKLDANRNIGEAAQGNAIAEDAWFQFHNMTNHAQTLLGSHFGAIDVSNADGNTITGTKALLFDVHGYSGKDWVPDDGSPFIQWGYRLADETSLNPDAYCPLDDRSDGTIGTLTHARWMDGHSYECLVRGPGSLGSRVVAELDSRGGSLAGAADVLCGRGTPSYEYESPWALANDPAHCDRVANGGSECHYYSGGFDVQVHERMDWENMSGDHFNTVQAELPRCIRFGGSSVREEFADVLSVAVMSFLRDLYGEPLFG